jgi:hypothetical protein
MDRLAMVAQHSPGHKPGECWEALKSILPQASDGERFLIMLWWSGKLPWLLKPLAVKALSRRD